jgi:tRNA(Ile)-lysidine synthase
VLDTPTETSSDTTDDSINDAWRAVGLELYGHSSLLLAVSGGSDSLAMLVGLSKLRDAGLLAAALTVQTIDHGLRPEAAQEAKMVGEVCAELGVPFQVTKLGRKPFARNAQDWARTERYGALSRTAAKTGAVILTAHTADDQAETLLMRAARGTGCEGLAGIRPETRLQGARVVRPFLDWPRAELHRALHGTAWQPTRDPSNADESYTRVRFRNWLADAPTPDGTRRVADGLAETAHIAELENEALDHYAQQLFASIGGATHGFVEGNVALCAQPLVVQARFLRLALDAVARNPTPSPTNRNLAFGLGRMVALARRIANEPKGKWVGGGAVLEWQSGIASEHLSAYAEAGRAGFPQLDIEPGENGQWDGRFEVWNWSAERLTIRAWQSTDPDPVFDGDRPSKQLLASLPVAQRDEEVVATVGGVTKEACREAGTVFLGALKRVPEA